MIASAAAAVAALVPANLLLRRRTSASRLFLLFMCHRFPAPRNLRFFCCKTLAKAVGSDKPPTAAAGERIREFKKRLRIADVKGGPDQGLDRLGQRLSVRGWVRTCRVQRSATFIEVNDGSCLSNMQCVMTSDAQGYDEVEAGNVSNGASIIVDGIMVSSQGSKQKVELKVERLVMIGKSDPSTYPIQKKRASREYLRTIAHLRPRTNTFGAVARVRNALAYATHRFFQENGFVWISSPIITASDCEGAGEQFYVTTLIRSTWEGNDCPIDTIPATKDGSIDWSQDFFGKPAFLTVSGQLNAETYASALSDVYTFGPTFRAENSNTSRHLAEFWMIEPELAFADLSDDMACATAYLQYVVKYVLENCKEDMDFFNTWVEKGITERLTDVVQKEFVQLTYSDAIQILLKAKKKFEFPVKWEFDLQSEHERYITEDAFAGRPVIIRDYPKDIKAFYMHQNDDCKTVAAMDVLVPRVNDGSCLSNMQCVMTSDAQGYDEVEAGNVSNGASIIVDGIMVSSQGSKQKVELKVERLVMIGKSDPSTYPIQKKRASREYLRTIAHLRPRTNTFGAVARVRNALAYATHRFFQENGFVWISSPIITASDCEGAGEQFYVTILIRSTWEGNDCPIDTIPATKDGSIDWSQDFFGKPAFLTVSGQLNAETYASALSDVYTFGPTFRAENSNTSRHLAEFWMIEPELAFADLSDDMACATAYLQYVVKYVLENCKEDMDFFNTWVEKGITERLTDVVEKEFVQLTYSDAIQILLKAKKKFEFSVKWGFDLQSEHERYITEDAFAGHPVIIRDYPKDIKAFYMHQNDDCKTVAAMDVLVPRVSK